MSLRVRLAALPLRGGEPLREAVRTEAGTFSLGSGFPAETAHGNAECGVDCDSLLLEAKSLR